MVITSHHVATTTLKIGSRNVEKIRLVAKSQVRNKKFLSSQSSSHKIFITKGRKKGTSWRRNPTDTL